MAFSAEELKQDWREFEYAVVDLEGTGAQHRDKEGIVDIAVVLVRDGSVTNEVFHRLLDPGIKIPSFISRIHGIYDKDVVGRPTFSDIDHELQEFLGSRLMVAHNAPVERRVLTMKLPDYRPRLIFDTLKMARKLFGTDSKHGLDDLIDRLHLPPLLSQLETGAKRHGALYDTVATAHAFVTMAYENFPGGCPLVDLADMCALDWHNPILDSKAQENTDASDGQSSFGW